MTRRLGKGLADIIDSGHQTTPSLVLLKTEQIRTGRFQPRASINESSLEELKTSIKRSGVIEPIIVRPVAHGTYELVAGERRFRAAQAVDIKEVPAIIKMLSDQEALEISLVENVQRENLNPLEEARGYARLLDEFGYTQEDVADTVGKDRTTIANLLRLLALPEEIRQGLKDEAITMGHAKVLLSVQEPTRQLDVYRRAKNGALSVRQTETLAGAWTASKRRKAHRLDAHLKELEDELRKSLGTKVILSARAKGGRIIVEYFSHEDLSRLLQILGVSV